MAIAKRKDRSRLGAIDYALMSAGSCFAAFSAGMAVGQPLVAQFFVYAILAGTGFSLVVRSLLAKSLLVRFDGILYACAAMSAVLFAPSLNEFLPGEGIPPEVVTAGWLCWMMALGSFLTWRDGTLLFQAVPTIALFGLVGCYDTYRPAPFLFFGFLLCLATLLARAHSREMLRQAVESGFFNRADAPNTPTEQPEQSPELYEDIKRGPWRWIAGPEWALMSGLAIVAVSLLGAPVIHEALQPFSNVIKIVGPHIKRQDTPQLPSAPVNDGSYQVGKGPMFDVGAKPQEVFEAQMDHVRYLRTASYGEYTSRGWKVMAPPADGSDLIGLSIQEMKPRRAYMMTLNVASNSQVIPLPAETTSVRTDGSVVNIDFDGGGKLTGGGAAPIQIAAIEATGSPKDAVTDLPAAMSEYGSEASIDLAVRMFADRAVKDSVTDIARANAIRDAIAAQCKYSLKAQAVPEGKDAAEFFLLESRVGYCDLFATAMVVCARAEQIPARYVVGYLPDEKNSTPSKVKGVDDVVITDHDYHAWAELYFKNVGWVVFDPTGEAQLAPDDSKANAGPLWKQILRSVFNTAVLMGVVIFAGWWLLGRYRAMKGRRTVRGEIEREYLAFSRALAHASGRRRGVSETPDEYFAAVSASLNGAMEAGTALNARLVRALYGGAGVSFQDAASIRADVRAFQRMSKRPYNGNGGGNGSGPGSVAPSAGSS